MPEKCMYTLSVILFIEENLWKQIKNILSNNYYTNNRNSIIFINV